MSIIPSIYLWGLGSALFALAGMLVAHRLVKPIDLAQHQPSLDATLNIVGTLVSILLGLLVAASLTSYQSLQSTVDSEATSVSEICRLSFGLSPEEKKLTWCRYFAWFLDLFCGYCTRSKSWINLCAESSIQG